MFSSLLIRWLLVALFLGLLVSSRLPGGAAARLGRWPRAAVDFVVLPAADPLRQLSARLPGIAPEGAKEVLADAELRERLAWALRENDRLKAQLRSEHEAVAWFKQISTFVKFEEVALVSAGVAAGEVNAEHPSLTLSSGTDGGLAPHQVVVGPGAELVGVIEDSVGRFSCRVRAFSWPKTVLDCRIMSPKHEGDGIPVRLRANDKGTAFECEVDIDTPVQAGDVVTFDDSSYGGYARGFVVGRVSECLDLRQIDRNAAFDGSTGAGKRAEDARLAKDLDKSIFYKRLIVRTANNLARLDRVIVLVPREDGAPAKTKAESDVKPAAQPEAKKEPLP